MEKLEDGVGRAVKNTVMKWPVTAGTVGDMLQWPALASSHWPCQFPLMTAFLCFPFLFFCSFCFIFFMECLYFFYNILILSNDYSILLFPPHSSEFPSSSLLLADAIERELPQLVVTKLSKTIVSLTSFFYFQSWLFYQLLPNIILT